MILVDCDEEMSVADILLCMLKVRLVKLWPFFVSAIG